MKSTKMKLPNSYGSVCKMSNATRRRKPYMVRITKGYEFDEKRGKSIQKYAIIGYATTRTEGLQMLAKYHDSPFDLENKSITFEEVYNLWSESKYENTSNSTINGYKAAYKLCTKLYTRAFRDIKTADLQNIIDTCNKNYPTLKKLRILFNQLYDYSMKNDICNKDYSRYVNIKKYFNPDQQKFKRAFTKEQIDILWNLSEDKYYQIILMLIYTGLRISELLNLKKEDIHLDKSYLNVTSSKTTNGIRKVPINKHILPFIKNWYNSSKIEYLLHTENQQKFNYRNYTDSYFTPLLKQIGINDLTPHNCRHTFISLLAEKSIDPTFIKMMAGHKGAMSLTEKVYTHIDIKVLIDAVNQIYIPSK